MPSRIGAGRGDDRGPLEARDVCRVKVTHVHVEEGRHGPADLGHPGHAHVDLGRVDVAEVPEIEGGLVRGSPEPPWPERRLHELVERSPGKGRKPVQAVADPVELLMTVHVHQDLQGAAEFSDVIRRRWRASAARRRGGGRGAVGRGCEHRPRSSGRLGERQGPYPRVVPFTVDGLAPQRRRLNHA